MDQNIGSRNCHFCVIEKCLHRWEIKDTCSNTQNIELNFYSLVSAKFLPFTLFSYSQQILSWLHHDVDVGRLSCEVSYLYKQTAFLALIYSILLLKANTYLILLGIYTCCFIYKHILCSGIWSLPTYKQCHQK